MKYRRQHLLLIAAAALAIGVAPAWSPMANADEAVAADDTSTSSEVPAPAAPTEPTEPADPAGVVDTTEPVDPVDPVDTPVDEVTGPQAGDDSTAPVTEPDDPTPVGADSDQPVTAAEVEGGEDGGGHDDGGGTLPDGVTVTVDGRDIKATDPEGSLPKIASCTFDITASGLTVEPPDTVGVRIVAWPPTAPGESPVQLVDVTETSADGAWTGSFPLDEAVQQFERKPNGYHMRLEILINGEMGAMKMYWLGCGEPQSGNPRRMLFDVQWFDPDGILVTEALDDVLPAGWRDDFALSAASERGTAECSYLPGSDLLNCLYVNPGHGDDPGLVLPGEPGTSYTVSVAGVPKGWVADPEALGTFLADDTCPKGEGGHDDGDHADTTARAEGEEGEQEPCIHTVAINQLTVEPPPDDGGGGNVDPPADDDHANPPNGGGNANPPAGNAAGLPLTGATSLPLVPVGLMLLLVGTALVVSTRRPMVVVDA